MPEVTLASERGAAAGLAGTLAKYITAEMSDVTLPFVFSAITRNLNGLPTLEAGKISHVNSKR